MCLIDDGVRPEVCRSIVESGENASFCIWETPVCLIAWIWRRVWCCDVNATCVSQIVSDICSRILITCQGSSAILNSRNATHEKSNLPASWVYGHHQSLVAVQPGKVQRRKGSWVVLTLYKIYFGKVWRLCSSRLYVTTSAYARRLESNRDQASVPTISRSDRVKR
jgi:hypothetical protein